MAYTVMAYIYIVMARPSSVFSASSDVCFRGVYYCEQQAGYRQNIDFQGSDLIKGGYLPYTLSKAGTKDCRVSIARPEGQLYQLGFYFCFVLLEFADRKYFWKLNSDQF